MQTQPRILDAEIETQVFELDSDQEILLTTTFIEEQVAESRS